MRLEEFPQSTHLSEHGVCTTCFKNYLWAKIMDEGTIDIQCPGELCPQSLEYSEIKEFGGEKAFSKYPPFLNNL